MGRSQTSRRKKVSSVTHNVDIGRQAKKAHSIEKKPSIAVQQHKLLKTELRMQDKYLKTGPSTIEHAGTGVFAKVDIPKDTSLGYYRGKMFHRFPHTNKRKFAYFMEISRRPPWISKERWMKGHPMQIDGNSILSLMNCSRGDCLCMNVDFTSTGRFFTTKVVKKDSELFTFYGKDYWEGTKNPILDKEESTVSDDSDFDNYTIGKVGDIVAECVGLDEHERELLGSKS